MLADITRGVLAGWDEHFPGQACPAEIDYLNACGSIDGGTTTFLAFDGSSRAPLFCVKTHRHPDGAMMLEREASVLTEIGQSAVLAPTVPRLVLAGSFSGRQVLVQSIVPGRAASLSVDRSGFPLLQHAAADLAMASEWLQKLQHASLDRTADAAGRARTRLLDTSLEFRNTFEISARALGLLAFAAEAIGEVLAPGVVIRHGDFCRHNLLLDQSRRRLSVIDWTFCSREGLALSDFLFFVATYFLHSGRAGLDAQIAAFRRTFLEDNEFSSMVARSLGAFSHRLGIDERSRQLFLVWFLVEQAVFECRLARARAKRGTYSRAALALAAERGYGRQVAPAGHLWVGCLEEIARA